MFLKSIHTWDSSRNQENLELNATKNKGSPTQLLPAIQVNPDKNNCKQCNQTHIPFTAAYKSHPITASLLGSLLDIAAEQVQGQTIAWSVPPTAGSTLLQVNPAAVPQPLWGATLTQSCLHSWENKCSASLALLSQHGTVIYCSFINLKHRDLYLTAWAAQFNVL